MDLWHLASILIVINILFALSSGKKIVCSHCGKKLELEQADKEELEKYGEINFTCPNCGKESTYDGSDNEEEEWTCEHCEEPLVLTDDEQKKLDRTAKTKAVELAEERQINYVSLKGNIGMIADGAGTGMLTLDMIYDMGARPANFCEMGGMANAEIMNLLDADDTFFTSSHFAAFNVAGALAECQRLGRSGRELILGTAVGFDVNARLNLASIVMGEGTDGSFEWASVSGMGFAAFGTAASAATT